MLREREIEVSVSMRISKYFIIYVVARKLHVYIYISTEFVCKLRTRTLLCNVIDGLCFVLLRFWGRGPGSGGLMLAILGFAMVTNGVLVLIVCVFLRDTIWIAHAGRLEEEGVFPAANGF